MVLEEQRIARVNVSDGLQHLRGLRKCVLILLVPLVLVLLLGSLSTITGPSSCSG